MKVGTENILAQALQNNPQLHSLRPALVLAFDLLLSGVTRGGTLFVCGNGGSAADAEHCVGELLKGFRLQRALSPTEAEALSACCGPSDGAYLAGRLQRGIRAMALTSHPALTTAVGNDTAGDMAFAQQLYVLGSVGDVLLGLSTSGNARNVLLAAQVAHHKGMKVLGMTGAEGGALRALADLCICVPAKETYRVQEYHLPLYHMLCAMLEAELF